MQPIKLIILNGPPDSGKDTAANHLVEKHGYTKLEMKSALRKMAYAITSLHGTEESAKAFCDMLENNRELKENVRVPQWGYRTWREFLIHISEGICKPIFGSDIFALAAAKAVKDSGADRVVFSDGGFQVELDTLYKHVGDGLLVRVYREGRNFAKLRDSRRYLDQSNGKVFSLVNEAGLVQFHKEIDHMVKWYEGSL